MKYDDYGNLLEVATWGIDGKPCAIVDTCRNSFTYDGKENLTKIIHYDLDGHYTKDIINYDERRNNTIAFLLLLTRQIISDFR